MTTQEFYQYVNPNSKNIENTNTEFLFEFPTAVQLGVDYECAIIESYIPHTQYNVAEDQFFFVVISFKPNK